MHKYEMDPTRTVEAIERTRDVGRTRDGRSETNIPPQQLRCAGGIKINRAWRVPYGFVHQRWAQSNQRFVYECMQTAQLINVIRDQEIVGKHDQNESLPGKSHNDFFHQIPAQFNQ